MAGDLKSHVEEHHKDAALAKKKTNLSMDELVWLSYNLVIYRNLMEPTDRNATAFTRLGSLLLGWPRKILAILAIPAGPKVKRGRYDLIKGWDRPVNDFRVFSTTTTKSTLILHTYSL